MIKKTYILFIIILFVNIAFAQQLPVFRNYYANEYLFNPAKAGSNSNTKAMMHYRKNWLDVEGAPETTVFSIDGLLPEKPVAVGLILTSDISNIIGRTSGYISYSYKLKITENQKINFGLSAGLLQNKINFDRIRAANPYETSLLEHMEATTTFDANAGLQYTFKGLDIGFSALQILNNKINYLDQNTNSTLNYQLIRQFYADIKYDIKLKDNFSLIPLVVLRGVQGMPFQYDFALYGKFANKYWLNIAYSPQFGAGFGIGGLVYSNFMISYNYDVSLGTMLGLSGNSHEISVGYVFNKSKSGKTGQNNKIKTDYNEYERINQERSEQIDEVEQKNQDLTRLITEKDKAIEEQNKEIERLKSENEKNKGAISKEIDDHKIEIDKIENVEKNSTDLELGYYMIVGVYKYFENAKSFQKILKDKLNVETAMFQVKDSELYYIYTIHLEDKNDANKEFRRLNKLGIEELTNSKIWVFKINSADQILK